MKDGSDINKLRLVSSVGGRLCTLFDEPEVKYVIPLYQRAFAWGMEKYSNRENEIIQMMDDVMDIGENENYYLSSLIVYKRSDGYEVIDGQQRLTALFLLFSVLGLKPKPNTLTYSCREGSNNAIRDINELIEGNLDGTYEKSICEGIKTIQKKISCENAKDSNYEKRIADAFRRVTLFRICIPEGTDLNRYFEIMNTRGEQLEQHDIVKADLMRRLGSDSKRALFAEAWDACRDMTGYVQMHFGTKQRIAIFGSNWDGVPDVRRKWSAWRQVSKNIGSLRYGHSFEDILSREFKVNEIDGFTEDYERVRFESIIDFPHFLLHVLKVFSWQMELQHPSEGREQLDDKKLIASFDSVFNKLEKIKQNKGTKKDYAWLFLDTLIWCRFLFDQYIIKREYKDEDSDGEWSLKTLTAKNRRPYYVNTVFRNIHELKDRKNNLIRNEQNKMIQACLRVSYTSPKVMHWITDMLWWFCENNYENYNDKKLQKFCNVAENIAIEAIKEFISSEEYDMGVNTPHIVLNFLDYLLWREWCDKEAGIRSDSSWDGKGEPFEFEFRNSVEHWYPRNPSDGMYDKMENVDRFGNLCLIQRNINSKFSNLSPVSKMTTYKDMIARGSIKLRLMAKMTAGSNDKQWREKKCEEHENKMLNILRKAVEYGEE